MLYPDEPGKVKPSDELHRWAQLEGKSDSMADELVLDVQEQRKCCRGANPFALILVIATLLAVLVGSLTAIPQRKDAENPPANSLAVPSDNLRPRP